MKTKIRIVSIFPQYSALCTYGFFLNKYLSKNKRFDVKFIDLWKNEKYHPNVSRALALLQGIKIEDSDVLILVAPLLCSSLKKSKAKLKITIAHDLYPLTIGKDVSLAVKSLVKATYKNLKDSDIILPVSEFCKSEIIEKYGLRNKLIKINGGIDHTKFKSLRRKHSKKINLLHIGRNDPRKNFSFVLELLRNTKGAKLTKIGTISGKDLDFIRKNNLNVEVLKIASEKALINAYNSADILVFPSFYEGLGLPPIEAMACGLPVIAANNTGLKEVCIKESLTPLKLDLWEKKIKNIINNKQYRNKLISKGLKQSKKFDWKLYVKNIEKIILKNI